MPTSSNERNEGVRPPAADIKRRTPRSLSRTLRKLRETGHRRTVKEMADSLKVAAEQTVRNWETPGETDDRIKFRITVDDLNRYQDLLGIPIGIIMVVSQILADARDANDRRLEVQARMLSSLSNLIATPEKRREAIAQVTDEHGSGDQTTYKDWDNFLSILLGAVWGAAPPSLRKSFENTQRLQAHEERLQAHEGRAQSKQAAKKAREGR